MLRIYRLGRRESFCALNTLLSRQRFCHLISIADGSYELTIAPLSRLLRIAFLFTEQAKKTKIIWRHLCQLSLLKIFNRLFQPFAKGNARLPMQFFFG